MFRLWMLSGDNLAAEKSDISPNIRWKNTKLFTECIRDLKIYSSALGDRVSYYHDRYGLEADCVLHLRDGKYALIEFKLGSNDIEDGAAHLKEIETLVRRYNKTEMQAKLRLPDLKLIITGTQYGYRRPDGVYVIPIGCLRN